jgi:nucleotide-binding universal stress UspA family protein
VDKILVALDGSSLAESALSTAIEMARVGEVTVILFRATGLDDMIGTDPRGVEADGVREATEYLGRVAERLTAAGVRKVVRSVWHGPAAAAIIEAARLMRVDLIVMTTHGRSGIGRLIWGSVAESVLRGAPASILLLRSPGAAVEPPAGADRARPARPTEPIPP